MVIELLSPIIGIATRLWHYAVTRNIRFVVEFDDNLSTLRRSLMELKDARDDIKREVIIAERQLLECTSQAKGWLQRVEDIEEEVKTIEIGLQKRRSGLNCRLRYKLGKRVVKAISAVAELKSKGVFQVVPERSLPNPVNEMPSAPSVGVDSRLEKLRGYLREDDVGIIGIYGMGGVGKTTLLKKINNDFLQGNHVFDVVIWLVVSKDPEVEKIHYVLEDRLGLTWQDHESQDDRAGNIFRVLSKKKFILLLDDVWKRLDLDEVGIPLPNEQNKCKIIFTARSMDVCSDMDAHTKLKVEFLEEKEAWALFQEKVGKKVRDSPEIRTCAEIIVKKCGGLPLALITIGRAMANKDSIEEWTDSVRVLNKSPSELRGMEEDVFSLLKFSFDNLHDDTIRDCFLYCSIFPEDYSIEKEQLIEYWIGEGHLDECNNINEAQNMGHAIIGNLKAACLLETGDEETQVKMHDVIRGLALWIASECGKKKNKFLAQASLRLTEAPGVEKWKEAERISLMDNEIFALTESPVCPNLLTLILQWNIGLHKISNSFFQFMPVLRVLDLSFTSIKEFPVGIGELVELRHLDLSRTKITSLPEDLGNLAKLKHLNLQRTHSLERIPRGLIPRLSRLEVLNLYYTFGGWEVGGSGNGNGAGFADMECLRHLTTLGITITSVATLSRYACSGTLPNCTCYLYVNECDLRHFELSSDAKSLQRLSIKKCSELKELIIGVDVGENWLLRLQFLSLYELPNLKTIWGRVVSYGCLRNLRYVNIWYCHKLKNITWVLQLQSLEAIALFNCAGMDELVSGDEVVDDSIMFPRLRKISIRELPELKSIYMYELNFPALKTIAVTECPKLKSLPLGAHSARSLQTIYGEREWWDGLEWNEDSIKSAFIPYFNAV
ncbi:NB-ARC domain-containing disease resistance protein [Tasmannia lanceolata]|uniref:NB-ARC domain-containing disease resistance protein n=1 Tax=Tasmannia lanceolata TaxID=3420 RepID=UPI004062B66C